MVRQVGSEGSAIRLDHGHGRASGQVSAGLYRKTVELTDPAAFDEATSVSRHLPGQNSLQTYRLRDRALARSGKRQLLSCVRYEWAGDLQLSHVAERFGMEIGIPEPGLDLYCFGRLDSGRMLLTEPDRRRSVELRPGQSAVHRSLPSMFAATADATTRTNFWLAASRFDTAVASYLKEPPRERLTFFPLIDWASVSFGSLGRLVAHIEAEFARGAGGVADNVLGLSAFCDLFVHSALAALPHNQAERIARLRDGPAPRHVRRAEDFFRAHAHEPILMQDAAAAAGCSVRALQQAFRRFRDISPHGALMNARFEQARVALLADQGPVRDIARRFGFSHAGRFAAAYARRYGEAPSKSRRNSEL